ncbi:hypothetical protein KIW84_051225 [Lathyrus oleraceus]|uniref:Uncharacterized protein n=1 Tax=Pisum sativum TaxID=3888 RepID=A0A9D5AAF0_PEA|nr:hypothetical protein KIW84_051225 [Pisum sativum]
MATWDELDKEDEYEKDEEKGNIALMDLTSSNIKSDSYSGLDSKQEDEEESTNHPFFGCKELNSIWEEIFKWMEVVHTSREWNEELLLIIGNAKGKGWKAVMMKLAIAETVYGIWKCKNYKIFIMNVNITNIVEKIIELIVYRGSVVISLKTYS